MSHEQILEIFSRFGFTTTDTEVYLCLILNGPQNSRSVAHFLSLLLNQVNQSLKHLVQKQAITKAKHPLRFWPIPLKNY